MSEIAGRLLIDGELVGGRLRHKGGRIVEIVRDPLQEHSERVIAPGFIDLHVHGFGGFGPLENLVDMARALATHGTTAFQPTLFPDMPARLGERCAQLEREISALGEGTGARVLGLHLEGPFVNPAAAGALPPEDLAAPSRTALGEILGPSTGSGRAVRTMTVAPELPGMLDLIAELSACGVRASLGHSRANEAQARTAVAGGALGATHLYNAMTGLHHRDAGMVGTILTEPLLFAEIIGDLVHVAAPAFEIALHARGPHGLCLVSDALAGAGTGCDVFHASGREHFVADGAAFYPATAAGQPARLAGSASSQLEMVRKLTKTGVVTLSEALTMASQTPARALGLGDELGVLALGARADLIVLRGHQLDLEETYIGGRLMT